MTGNLESMVKALKFYADAENWIDTPSWDGDPTCVTPKAIPVTKEEDGSRLCDCGDVARAALASLNEAASAGVGPTGAQAQTLRACEKNPHIYCNCDGNFFPACRDAPASTSTSPGPKV
ncbi:hypothetical protein EN780_03370 [Mesorhizobium sp. M4B.F.Ca.ET.089.01.1.1]|uniref:hypothetical protein n=1 Tax=Mesorhizobium sp. M4B.F.Ca.ET.089.01.1.1 TaxID=2496662 RepID=UPI000FE3C4A3|nr:hypothetical protein [Mesorhizobium sp. M4B.F.Ca.ET.089.01.1.1]RWX70448.1 hypothetical protein EN780_03370 [Mesorhizobium sp. M4B.F.Ca.ET.089.01.1.1]